MGKTTKYTLNAYESGDYRQLEGHLNRMSAQGWRLKKIGLFLLRFDRSGEPGEIYSVDIFHKGKHGSKEDYMELCAEAGWEPVSHLFDIFVFRAPRGSSPIPIQTDPEMEFRAVKRSLLPIDIAFLLFGLLFLVFSLSFANFPNGESRFLSRTLLDIFWFPLFYTVLALCYFFYAAVDLLWILRQKKRLNAHLPLRPMSRRVSRARQWTALLFLFFALFFSFQAVSVFTLTKNSRPENSAVLTLSDIGVTGQPKKLSYTLSSELVPAYTHYREELASNADVFIQTAHWECKDEQTAAELYTALIGDRVRGKNAAIHEIPPALWGAEDACRPMRPGDGEKGLDGVLFRKGSSVWELRGGADFEEKARFLQALLFSEDGVSP